MRTILLNLLKKKTKELKEVFFNIKFGILFIMDSSLLIRFSGLRHISIKIISHLNFAHIVKDKNNMRKWSMRNIGKTSISFFIINCELLSSRNVKFHTDIYILVK